MASKLCVRPLTTFDRVGRCRRPNRPPLNRRTCLRALERLMGMLLVLLATQMLLNGVRKFVQSLRV